MTKKTKRVRRQPEEARTLILDAAEKSIGKAGLASLRLQDVAKEAGLSHPTILHHFGSREGLVRALNRRSLERLTMAASSAMDGRSSSDGVAMTFAAYRNGLAQRMVWLMQSADLPPAGRRALFAEVVDKLHQTRQRYARPGAEPDIADTRAVIHLITIAAFGDALIGARLRQSGTMHSAPRESFERWFAALLDMYFRAKA